MAQDKSFLGTGWAFPPAFDNRTRAARLARAEDDIEQSLRILFNTTPGERVMQPTYGCDLKFMVFESLDESVLTRIRDAVERAVLFFEVRITLHDVMVDHSEWIDGILKIGLDYSIRGTNTRANLVFPLYLLEGTAVGHQA